MLNASVWLLLALQEAPVPADPGPVEQLKQAERTTPLVLDSAPVGAVRPLPQASGDFFWTIFWSVAVIALLGLVLWALRRFVRQGRFVTGGGVAAVLARVALDPHRRVWVLDVGRTIFLVGGGKDGLSSLGSIRDPEEVAEIRARAAGGESARRSFETALKQERREGERDEEAGKIREQIGEIRETVKRWGNAGA